MPSHDVTPLQTALAAKGYDVGVIDGIYGLKTKAAMRGYQAASHLTVSDQPTEEVCKSLGVTLAADFPYQPIQQRSFNLPGFLDGPLASAYDYFLNFIQSKIVWAAGAMVAVAVTWITTKFGLTVPPDIQQWVTSGIIAAFAALIAWLRTFKSNPKVVQGVVVK